MASYTLGQTHAQDMIRTLGLAAAAKNLRVTYDSGRDVTRARRRAYLRGYTDAMLQAASE